MTLARRCFLGAAVRDGPAGIEVRQVWPGSMAAQAGAQRGDLIRAFGGAVAVVRDLADACRRWAERPCRLVLERAGAELAEDLTYVPFPREEVAGAEVSYGDHDGLRTILVTPTDARTVVCFLPGIAYESVDFALRQGSPSAHLLAGLARAGVATYRIERPGLGDSPGPARDGFLEEQAVYRAGLRALRAERAAFERVVIFGHSVGGMHAPMLADLADALIVYGSSARRWSTCLREGWKRQHRLRGVSGGDRWRWPALRTTRFHEELDAVDLRAAWDQARVPSLVLIGEHDWVVSEPEQRELPADVALLEGLDHALTWHASRAESLSHFGRGALSDQVAAACARWLRAAPLTTSPPTSPGGTRA